MSTPTIQYRTLPARLEVRADGDGRTISGTVMPYGETCKVGGYTESFAPGSFDGTDPAAVKLLVQHDRERLPIGVATSFTDTATGFEGSFKVSKTSPGDDVLELIRDGVVSGLSVGFLPIPDGDRWSADRTRVERTRAQLVEVSVVAWPAYDGARIHDLRSLAGRNRSGTPRLTLARLVRHR
jgi:Escherichia/Staphylococcus phage prohead protease